MSVRTTNEAKASGLRRSLLVGGLALGLLVTPAAPAFAQTSYGGVGGVPGGSTPPAGGNQTPDVGGVVVNRPPENAAPNVVTPDNAAPNVVTPDNAAPNVVAVTPVAAAPVEVLGTTQRRTGGQLPVTGGDVAGLAGLGLGLVAVGAVVVSTRRGSTATTA